MAAAEDHEALEREALDHEPGAGDAPSEADEVEAAWADDLSSGPSEEELRAERGKDASGHFEELGTPQGADRIPEPPAIPGVPPHPETGPGGRGPRAEPRAMSPPFQLAYNTNGLAHHRLLDAMPMLAELGYTGIAITADVGHLDPYALDAGEVAAVRRLADLLGLGITIETGARFVLDP